MEKLTEKELNEIHDLLNKIRNEMKKELIGQDVLLDQLLTALICNQHILLEGVPGLAKTLAVTTLARVLELSFQRIQFTPDLLPADLIGTLVFQPKEGTFIPKKGPLFANLILADEINRAPAKVQSALLEAMAERQVTIGETTYPLPEPFMVMATQNPLEQEGTYPLPEAQTDRFMVKVLLDYPERDEELAVMRMKSVTRYKATAQGVSDVSEIEKIRQCVDRIYVDSKVEEYVVDIVRATRSDAIGEFELSRYLDNGASPRASISLVQTAKARALMNQRDFATPEDVKFMAPFVLRHRIMTSYIADAEGFTADSLIEKVLENIKVP